MTRKVTPVTSLHAYGGSRILMQFDDAHEVLPCVLNQIPWFAEDDVDSGRQKTHEFTLIQEAEEFKKQTTYMKQNTE